MREIAGSILIGVLLLTLILGAGCTQAPVPDATVTSTPRGTPVPSTTPFPVPEKGVKVSEAELIAFVDNAAAFAREAGKERAIATFNDPSSSWNRGALYIFAEGMDGTALAEPFEPELVGTNMTNWTDGYGVPILKNVIAATRQGKGLVSYSYWNPAHNNTLEPKLSYVVNVDGTYYVGAGMYSPGGKPYPASGISQAGDFTEADLVTFVRGAVDYAKANGKDKAISAFSDPKGAFIKGEMYITAYDSAGTSLANPYAPYEQGLNLRYYRDPDGVATVNELMNLAREGGGFAHTTVAITSQGKTIQAPELVYVMPVDGTWWVSASVLNPDYSRLRTGNLTGVPLRTYLRSDLYSLVNRAVKYAQVNGKEKALAEFSNPAGQFTHGDLFVWAESSDGILLADPYWNVSANSSLLNFTDRYGEKTTLVALDTMRTGSGFVHGMFPDTAHGGTDPVPKLMYLKAVNDTWWIGSGIYGVEVR
jgi:signal transduction histidine kinase